ncbi:MAG: hypothetical protein JW909_07945 [Planctomycetes bacterium]|nr:hypothetical protein [Planctomycetota bacterium]
MYGRKFTRAAAAAILLAAAAGTVLAWWPEGHFAIARAATASLPGDMPKFFIKAADTLAAYSVDPDLWKNAAAPALTSSERPCHYIDLELLKGSDLPPTLDEYRTLCRKLGTTDHEAGTLPYSVQENYERLLVAFAEYRRRPRDRAIQNKIIYIAGSLSHYTADASQPLHCTVHFDGRADTAGKSPRSGIHAKMDALPGNAHIKEREITEGLNIKAVDDVFALTMGVVKRSNGRVDEVYRLENLLPEVEPKKPRSLDADVVRLVKASIREGTHFTATVWYSAWVNSARVELPDWYNR